MLSVMPAILRSGGGAAAGCGHLQSTHTRDESLRNSQLHETDRASAAGIDPPHSREHCCLHVALGLAGQAARASLKLATAQPERRRDCHLPGPRAIRASRRLMQARAEAPSGRGQSELQPQRASTRHPQQRQLQHDSQAKIQRNCERFPGHILGVVSLCDGSAGPRAA